MLVIVTHDPDWSENLDERLRSLLREGRARVIVASAFAVVRRLLARADILVCPRSSWSGFPIKLINYMAAGKPVIAAEGSAKTIRDGQTGLTFPNGDAAALTAALKRLSQDVAVRRQLGESARATVTRLYSWQRAASQIEQIYAQVAGPARAPTGVRRLRAGHVAGIDSFRQRSYKRREPPLGCVSRGYNKDMRYLVSKIGGCLVLSVCVLACGHGTTRPVPLPPLEAAPEPGVSGEAAAGYRLQPGDILRVKFLYHPELDIKVPIRPDGNITLQLAGEIHAAGLHTTELEQVIKERTSDRLRDPEISVIVAQLAEQKVYVGGEVRLPGFVALPARDEPAASDHGPWRIHRYRASR